MTAVEEMRLRIALGEKTCPALMLVQRLRSAEKQREEAAKRQAAGGPNGH